LQTSQKKTSQGGQVQINLFKMALWTGWTMGQKNSRKGCFGLIFPIKKAMFSCNVG